MKGAGRGNEGSRDWAGAVVCGLHGDHVRTFVVVVWRIAQGFALGIEVVANRARTCGRLRRRQISRRCRGMDGGVRADCGGRGGRAGRAGGSRAVIRRGHCGREFAAVVQAGFAAGRGRVHGGRRACGAVCAA
jgi:hypothetical protein